MLTELHDLEALRDHLSASIGKAQWYSDPRKDLRTALEMAHRACEAAYDRLAMEAAQFEAEQWEEMSRNASLTVRWEEPRHD